MMKQHSHSGNILASIRVVKTRLEKILTEKPLLMVALVTSGTFILYLVTLIPEVGWGDSAELSLVAYQLGIAHPPGSPLHAILGKLISIFFAEPAIGVNLLSAIFTSLAAGVLSLLIFELTAMPLIAVLIAIAFSALPNIWEMAVVTEVYNVNIFFLGYSMYLFLRAEQSRFTRFLIRSAIFFGLSLGTYQANLLLLPTFILVLLMSTPRNKVLYRLAVFCSIIGLIWLAFLMYSVFRSHETLAFNYPLNSFQKIVTYAIGSDLRPPFPKNIAFYIERTIKHTSLFANNFLYLPVPIGLLGMFALLKQKKIPGLYLGIAFGINYFFFSYYAVSDYFTMPTPSYFIFSVFVGYGLACLVWRRTSANEIVEFASIALCILLIGAQLVNQLPVRFERSNTRPITELILPALEAFPKDAIVLSRWERYTPLLYFQHVRGIREDVTLVEADNYIDQISSYYLTMPDRPILIDGRSPLLTEKYKIKRHYRRWFVIIEPIK